MPLDEDILGFSSRWYWAAMKAAVVHRVSADLEVRVVTARCFLATKLEVFRGREQGDLKRGWTVVAECKEVNSGAVARDASAADRFPATA